MKCLIQAITTPPSVDVMSTDGSKLHHQCEISDVKRKISNLEDVVQTQGQELSHLKEQQPKKKRGLWSKKQPSKDEDCEKEIRDKESQIRFYQRKLDAAEQLQEQNLQLATDLSDKERKLEEVSKKFLALQQEMKGEMNENVDLRKQVADTERKYQDEVKQLKDELSRLQEQPHTESHVEVMFVDKEECSEQTNTDKGQIAQLQSRVLLLRAERDKALAHSEAQSRKILNLKQHIQGTDVSELGSHTRALLVFVGTWLGYNSK